jgi:hypothetical protein
MTPLPGFLVCTAINNASIVSSSSIRLEMAQPMIFLENKSITVAKYKNPDQILMYVMSATQTTLVAMGLKSLTKFSYTGYGCFESVV